MVALEVVVEGDVSDTFNVVRRRRAPSCRVDGRTQSPDGIRARRDGRPRRRSRTREYPGRGGSPRPWTARGDDHGSVAGSRVRAWHVRGAARGRIRRGVARPADGQHGDEATASRPALAAHRLASPHNVAIVKYGGESLARSATRDRRRRARLPHQSRCAAATSRRSRLACERCPRLAGRRCGGLGCHHVRRDIELFGIHRWTLRCTAASCGTPTPRQRLENATTPPVTAQAMAIRCSNVSAQQWTRAHRSRRVSTCRSSTNPSTHRLLTPSQPSRCTVVTPWRPPNSAANADSSTDIPVTPVATTVPGRCR